jgi:hypothetical protein
MDYHQLVGEEAIGRRHESRDAGQLPKGVKQFLPDYDKPKHRRQMIN